MIECFAQELFESKELTGCLNKMPENQYMICDSEIESGLAQAFERNDEVKIHRITKLV